MKRLFTFGCSFTKYFWPTWADIVARDYDFYVNWAKIAVGNAYISASIAEANLKYKFTKEDTVLIMWTYPTREDRYTHMWCTTNLFNLDPFHNHLGLTEDWVKKYITTRGLFYKNITSIYFTKKMLDGIGCNYKMLQLVDITKTCHFNYSINSNNSNYIEDLIKNFREVIDILQPSICDVVFKGDWKNIESPWPDFKERPDQHAIPAEHLEYLKKVINFTPSKETENWVNKMNELVLTNVKEDLCLAKPKPPKSVIEGWEPEESQLKITL